MTKPASLTLVLAIPNEPEAIANNEELPMVVAVYDKPPSHLAMCNEGLYPLSSHEAFPN